MRFHIFILTDPGFVGIKTKYVREWAEIQQSKPSTCSAANIAIIVSKDASLKSSKIVHNLFIQIYGLMLTLSDHFVSRGGEKIQIHNNFLKRH